MRWALVICAALVAMVALPMALGIARGDESSTEQPRALATGEAQSTPAPGNAPTRTPTPGAGVPEEPSEPPPPSQTPTAVPRVEVDCSPDQVTVRSQPLGIAGCFPPGWGIWAGGSDRADVADVEERSIVHIFSEEWFPYPAANGISADDAARLASGIGVSMSYAPDYATFSGCTPVDDSPVKNLPRFCEDVYDIGPTGDAKYHPAGGTVGWKFLAPVSHRTIDGFDREGGSILVVVKFPATARARAESQLIPTLATLVIR